ncbi:hypothetical protein PLEOSDRAFT_166885 [Pleurotus ostreatus PC15]|uniref:Uncharacterized protein n=1 Tax=Pleurotus ostreatus (strain PC15) TaxID=1137138 RepID=A0A067NX62_PLEO1|nr:hypothetical protein PLEOSDRAFT_166885 [Pleurotus ostreatus PC15]
MLDLSILLPNRSQCGYLEKGWEEHHRCHLSLSVRRCQGVRNPEHRGRIYQACVGRDHFCGWLPNYELLEADYGATLEPTFTSLLNNPLTPNIPRTGTLSTPQSTPSASGTITSNLGVNLEVDLGDLDLALNRHSSPAPTALTDLSPRPNVPRWMPNGKGGLKESCNGPRCQKLGKAVRFCSSCINKYCQKCCHLHQQQSSKICPVHKIPIASPPKPPSAAAEPPTTITPVKLSVMREPHYQALSHAQAQQKQDTSRLMDQKRAEQAMARTITVYIWKDPAKPLVVKTEAYNYPTFALDDCSSTVKRLLALDQQVYELFVPKDSNWVIIDSASVRCDIRDRDKILYRVFGVETGDSMAEQVNDLSSAKPFRGLATPMCTPSRKHAAESTPEPGRRVKPRLDERSHSRAPATPTQKPSTNSETSLFSFGATDNDDDDVFAIRPPAAVLFTPKTLPNPVSEARKPTPTNSTNTANLTLAPSSGHSNWPLKDFKIMAHGFTQYESIANLTHDEKFPKVWPHITKKPATGTWNTNYAAWVHSSDILRSKYLAQEDSLWKTFRHDVKEAFSGTIPGLRVPRQVIIVE